LKSATLTDESGAHPTAALFDRADYFILTAAGLSFLLSIVLWFAPVGTPNKEGGLYVAVWVPSILSLGCFAKLARKERRHG
jgi:hypothetical protein